MKEYAAMTRNMAPPFSGHRTMPGGSSIQGMLGLRDIPWTEEDLVTAFRDTVRANRFKECYIRPLMYISEGGWGLSSDGIKLSLGIAAWEWNRFHGPESREKGIRANVSSYTRHHPNVTMTKAKISGNYVNSILAKSESGRLGFDEAIMLDPQGHVAECPGENIFMVKKGQIVTSPAASILEGITRQSVETLANDAGCTIAERPISRDQLYMADEVFVCGTAAELIALREIDFRTVGSGSMGPVTKKLQDAYLEAVSGRGKRSPEWLTPID